MTFSTFDTSHFGWCHQGHLISNRCRVFQEGSNPPQSTAFRSGSNRVLGNKRKSDTIHTTLISMCYWMCLQIAIYKKLRSHQKERGILNWPYTYVESAPRAWLKADVGLHSLHQRDCIYQRVWMCVFRVNAQGEEREEHISDTQTARGPAIFQRSAICFRGITLRASFSLHQKWTNTSPSQELRVSLNFCYVKLFARVHSINKCSRCCFNVLYYEITSVLFA